LTTITARATIKAVRRPILLAFIGLIYLVAAAAADSAVRKVSLRPSDAAWPSPFWLGYAGQVCSWCQVLGS
jgi:hypothetical protein